MVTFFDELAADIDSARFHASDVGVETALSRLQVERTCDESDSAVVQGKEVLQSFLNALRVIDADVCALRGVYAGVHKNGGNVAAGEFGKHGGIGFRGHDGGTVDFAFEHPANALGHALRLVVSVGDDDFEAFLHGLIFKVFHQLWKKWIGDIRNDEAEHAAAARDQSAGVSVGIKIKFLDGFLHASSGTCADLVRTVDGSRDGGGGNFGELGDFFDVHRELLIAARG